MNLLSGRLGRNGTKDLSSRLFGTSVLVLEMGFEDICGERGERGESTQELGFRGALCRMRATVVAPLYKLRSTLDLHS